VPSLLRKLIVLLLIAAIGLQAQAATAMSLAGCAGPADAAHAWAAYDEPLQATVHDADECACKCTLCVVCHSPALAAAPAVTGVAPVLLALAGPAEPLPLFTTHPPQRPPRR